MRLGSLGERCEQQLIEHYFDARSAFDRREHFRVGLQFSWDRPTAEC